MKKALVICTLVFLIPSVAAVAQTEIRYLGNMGIAIIHKDSAIIIDGLHDFYENDYLQTDTGALRAMHLRQKPFEKIIAIAVTHKHSDHFDENSVSSVAKIHTAALILGGSQTRALVDATIQKRFTLITDTATVRVNSNIVICIRRIPHTWPQRHAAVENYRYEISWNNFSLVHLGDADTKQDAVAHLQKAPDVLVVPNWFLETEGVSLINSVNPGRVLVTHIAPGDSKIKTNNKINALQHLFKKHGDNIKISK